MASHCHCQTTRRRLALYYPGSIEDSLELWAAALRFGWAHDQQSGHVLAVELGGGRRFCSITELTDFVRGLVPDAFPRIQAQWVDDRSASLDSLEWDSAEYLYAMAPLPSSPLLWVLQTRGIETSFQPIRRVDNGEIWGYECLMRAHDAAGGGLKPDELLGWARQEHLLFALDRLCREQHVEHAAASGAPPGTHFFINFLPTAIYEPEVCLRSTLAAADRVGLDPECIVFEVVETEKIPDRNHLRHIIDFYRRRGFQVALDDLGAGHSDLVLLGDLSPDLIKIERELITKATTSGIHHAICRSIAEIGRQENKTVLAEGVETQEQWEIVRELGVDLVQGYLFGKPDVLPPTFDH